LKTIAGFVTSEQPSRGLKFLLMNRNKANPSKKSIRSSPTTTFYNQARKVFYFARYGVLHSIDFVQVNSKIVVA